MGHFQIPVSWYRDETMLHLMDKNPASIGVYVRSRKPISNKLRKMYTNVTIAVASHAEPPII